MGFRHLRRKRRLRAEHARTVAALRTGVAEQIWRDAASQLGAEMRRLSPRFLEFGLGRATTRVADDQIVPFTNAVASELCNDKPLSYRLLAEAGIPLPEQTVLGAGDLPGARSFLATVRTPIVAKPAHGSGGHALVGNIESGEQLERALVEIGRYDRHVLLERQVEGDGYRLLFLDGELLDAIRRPLPRLVGDGSSTVEELVFRESERRIAAGADAHGFKPFELDLDSLFALERAGYDRSAVLPAGVSLTIKTASNFTSPEETETVGDALDTAVVASARRAAEVLGPRLAGVDVVTPDPGRPLEETGGVVLEVNVPGIFHHYHVADPARATRVAVPILAALLAEASAPRAGRAR